VFFPIFKVIFKSTPEPEQDPEFERAAHAG
jgi:hypothetical protein